MVQQRASIVAACPRPADTLPIMSSTVLRLSSVSFRYLRSVPVLEEIDLAVMPGEIVRVDGRNGSGKSTLLRLAAGVVVPRDGSVTRHGALAYLPQRGDEPPPGFSAARWFGAIAKIRGDSGSDTRAVELLGELGWDRPARPLTELSRGTLAKVMLAATLSARADLLVIDEPLAALDQDSITVAAHMLRQAATGGAAVLVAEHTAANAIAADRTVRMDGGHLVDGAAQSATRWRILLRDESGVDHEQQVPESDRDALLRAALARGDQVLLVEPTS